MSCCLSSPSRRTSSRRSTIRPRGRRRGRCRCGCCRSRSPWKGRAAAGWGRWRWRRSIGSMPRLSGRRGSLRLYRKTRCNACRHIAARRRGRRYTAYRPRRGRRNSCRSRRSRRWPPARRRLPGLRTASGHRSGRYRNPVR